MKMTMAWDMAIEDRPGLGENDPERDRGRSHQETRFSGVEAAHKCIVNQETQFIQIDILGNQMQLAPLLHNWELNCSEW